MKRFDLGEVSGGSTGMDAFFQRQPEIVTPTPRVRVASLAQLNGFQRVSMDTLIHKSTRDLWSLRKEGEEFFIERLFQDGDPVKG